MSLSTVQEFQGRISGLGDLQKLQPIPSLRRVRLEVYEHLDECDVHQIMSRLTGIHVQLNCHGPTAEEQERLKITYGEDLSLEVQPCECGALGYSVDPFN